MLLPHIRALHKIYGPVNIIHFDAHLDTWKPNKYPTSEKNDINHGSMLWKAYEEGLTTKHNIHVNAQDFQGWMIYKMMMNKILSELKLMIYG